LDGIINEGALTTREEYSNRNRDVISLRSFCFGEFGAFLGGRHLL
jgi:hypothetical protein